MSSACGNGCGGTLVGHAGKYVVFGEAVLGWWVGLLRALDRCIVRALFGTGALGAVGGCGDFLCRIPLTLGTETVTIRSFSATFLFVADAV